MRPLLILTLTASLSAWAQAASDDPADAAFAAQNWEQTERLYRARIEKFPKDGVARLRLGIGLHGLGRYADALGHFQAVVTGFPPEK